MTRSLRSFAAAACCTAAALLTACGPSTALPSDYSSCKTPNVICLPASGAALCVDIATDLNNCGECGNVCSGAPEQGGSLSCVAGSCVVACPNGLSICGVGTAADGDGGDGALTCVDESIDPNHCGGCGTHCLDSQTCTNGACVAAGQPGQGTTACAIAPDGGVIYENLQIDRANCGACGNACAAAEICLAGACSPCDVAQCSNVCVDTNTDPNNCGACGAVAATCDNGTPRAGPSISGVQLITGTLSGSIALANPNGLLPAGSPTIGVTTLSGLRIAAVTVVAKLTNGGSTTPSNPLTLNSVGDANLSPASWSFVWGLLKTGSPAVSMPALSSASTPPETIELDFTAYDEQYMAGRSDAASHMASLVWTGSVASVTALTLTAPTATTTVAGTPGTQLAASSWVPLNGGPIVLTETLASTPSASSNIIGVELHSIRGGADVVLGGTNSIVPFTGATASITVNPNDLGVGLRSIVAEQVDVFGNRTLGPAFALTVGDITPYAGTTTQPILAHGTDNNDTIWLFGPTAAVTGSVCASAPAHMYAQPYDQPMANASAVGVSADGATPFCTDALYETFESTGVYGVKADGTGIARFDSTAGGGETGGFIVAPSPAKFAHIQPNSITGAAMAISDTNGNGWFANATKGTGDPSPEEAGAADGGTFVSIPQVGGSTGTYVQSSTAGALWSWIAVPTGTTPATQYQLDVFHPAISNNSTHIKSYLASTATGAATPLSLSVFPGGEFVWEETDSTSDLSVGAGRFDGTDQPVDITGATTTGVTLAGNAFGVGVQRTLTSSSFFVPSPGILVGLVPSKTQLTTTIGTTTTSTSGGYEVVEIDLTASPAKIYRPQTITASGATPPVPSGEVVTGGVTDRFGNFNTFTVSDDLKKVLYVTKATSASPVHDEFTINLLDLATGTVAQLYTSEFINNEDAPGNSTDGSNNGGTGALTTYPHFLHGMKSYAGLGTSSTTPPIVLWAEELPTSDTSAAAQTVYERLFYANYSSATPAPVQIDHLAFARYQGISTTTLSELGATVQLVAESVTADGIFFISDDGGGGELSLYGRAFDGTSAAQALVKSVGSWSLREDVGRQIALRADGAVLVGSLTGSGGGPLSTIYMSDAGQTAFDAPLRPLAGFTPDGNHAWVLDHLGSIASTGGGPSYFEAGVLVSLDLASGARTVWGDVEDFIVQYGAPSFAFLGSVPSTLYGADFVSPYELTPGLFTSSSAAPTNHVSTGVPLSASELGAATEFSSDLNEAVLSVGDGTFDITANKTNLLGAIGGASTATLNGPAARAIPNTTTFGPLLLPLWQAGTLGSDGVYKAYGGATFQAPITISAGAAFTNASAPNRLTPDFSQYLAHFIDGSQYYAMKLPGTGVAPLATAPQ